MLEPERSEALLGGVTYQVRLRCADGTEIDEDTCRVRRYELVCELHHPYELDAELWFRGAQDEPSLDDLAGAELELALLSGGGDFVRQWHGVVLQATYLGTFDGSQHVRVRVGPTLALLGIGRRSRIFQGVSVIDVAREVVAGLEPTRRRPLELRGVPDAAHAVVDYLVQYGESDLAFFRRILAEAGLTFTFVHDDGGERIVVLGGGQSVGGAHPLGVDTDPTRPAVVPVVTRAQRLFDRPCVHALERVRGFRPRTVSVEGWDWAVAAPAMASAEARVSPDDAWAYGEWYEHDPRRERGPQEQGTDPWSERAERLDGQHASEGDRIRGRGQAFGFEPGTTVELTGHPHPDLAETYLLTRTVHRGDCPEVDLAQTAAFAGPPYENAFEAQRADRVFVPRRCPKPRVLGPQTAIVVGPASEEIHTDPFGRIRVRMRWDREQRDRDDTSCWLRVAQTWAGAGWGTLFLPRVGMEVVVAFLDGDPDRPLVVGTVYNGHNGPPYPLPDDRTRSTIKTRSTPGGQGSNELRFDDAAGAEEVYVHAQRNLVEVVRHTHRQRVGRDQSVAVSGAQAQRIGHNRTVEVGGEEHVVVGKPPSAEGATPPPVEPATRTLEVHGSIATKAHRTLVLDATESLTLRVAGTSIEVTPAGIALAVDGGAKLDLTDAFAVASAGAEATLSMDAQGRTTAISARGGRLELADHVQTRSAEGTSLVLDGGAKLEAAGGASLALSEAMDLLARRIVAAVDGDATKLELAARRATLTSSDVAALEGAAASVQASATGIDGRGPKIDLCAAGLLNLCGALTKINE